MAVDSGLVLAALERARKRIAEPGAWCQGTFYQKADGREADGHGDACRFCGYGALHIETRDPLVWAYATDELDNMVGGHFPDWQDQPGRTQEEVIAVFDRAIEKRMREQENAHG